MLAFEPYDRNVPHVSELTLNLDEGETDLTVYFDDLHERDTSCFFRLTLLQGEGLTDERLGGAEIEDAAGVLEALRTDRIFYRECSIRLLTDYAPARPVRVRLAGPASGPVTMNVFADPAQASAEAILSEAGRAVALLPVDNLTPGCVALDLEVEVGGATLRRGLGVTYLPTAAQLDQSTLAERKAAACRLMQEHGQHTPARALVLLAAGDVERAEALLLPGLVAVEERHDCADFFLLPPPPGLARSRRRPRRGGPQPTSFGDPRLSLLARRAGQRRDVVLEREPRALLPCGAVHCRISLFPADVFPNSGLMGREQAAAGQADSSDGSIRSRSTGSPNGTRPPTTRSTCLAY